MVRKSIDINWDLVNDEVTKTRVEIQPNIYGMEGLSEDEKAKVIAQKEKGISKWIEETKEELSKTEMQLTWKNLDDIWVSRSEALQLATKVLNISQPLNFEEYKKEIKKYQDSHNIDIDGKIGKETFIEMKAERVVDLAADKFKEDWLSVWDLREIKNILPSLTFNSKNHRKLLWFVCEFSTKFKYKVNKSEYRLLIDEINQINKKSLESKKWKALKNSKEAKSFYATINDKNLSWDEKIKIIATDPTTLMVGWLLFLFWVIGWDSKYTDSFFKRIGWILWISMFWEAAWNKLWVGEMIKDWKEAISNSTKSWALKTITERTKEVSKDVTKYLKNWEYKNFFDFIPDLWNDISEAFWKTASSIWRYNNTLKKIDWGKNYIEATKLWVFQNDLMSDEKFGNTSRDNLAIISTKEDLNNYTSEKTKKALTDAWISDSEISTFIKKHLLENQFWDNKDAELVKDLFFTTAIYDKLKVAIANNWDYIENDENLNQKINQQILALINSKNRNSKNLWLELAKAIKLWKLDDFKLSDFTWDITQKEEIKNLITEIQKYNKKEEKIKVKIDEVKTINLLLNDNLSKSWAVTLINWALSNVYEINLEYTQKSSELDKAKTEKVREILQKSIDKGFWGEEVVMSNWSKKTSNEYFKEIKKELEIKLKEELSKKLEWFNKTIEELKTEIEWVTIWMKFNEARDKLEEIWKKYDNISGIKTEDILNIAKKQTNNFTSLIWLDSLFEVNNNSKEDKEKAKKLKYLAIEISNKYIDIESVFNTDLKKTPSDKTVEEYAKERFELLADFKTDSIKESKKKELIKSFENTFNKKFIESINNVESLSELEKVYSKYEISTNDLDSDLVGESVEEAFKTKQKTLKEKELLKLSNNNDKINKILIDSWVIDFFEWKTDISKKVLQNKKLKKILNLFDNTTPLNEIISFFIDVNSKTNPYKITKDIKEEAEDILKNLKDNIDIEIDWYIKTKYNKIIN